MNAILTFTALLFLSFSQAQIDHWETVVYETDTWKYITPTTAVAPNWTVLNYNDASWTNGQGGFGYGDNDDNTTFPSTISCYQRIEFNIVDINAIEAAVLNIDYDDAFVAYLNGSEVGRDNITSQGHPAYNQAADGLHEAQMYQGGAPESITISSSDLIQGANVLCVQTHNESQSSSDMSSRVFLSLGINNTSNNYGATPSWFNPPLIFSSSNLPIVVINTAGGASIPDEPKIDATMGIIYNGPGVRNYMTDPFNEFDGNIGIEKRGSSSQMFPKKQWGLEARDNFGASNDITVFNMAWDNDWILQAPYSDKSLIRNVLAYDMGWDLGQYTPRTKLVEVVLNGDYHGVYVFMEKIKRKDGKVGTNDLETNDIEGNELTGDYVIKCDKLTAGGVVAWSSPYLPYPGASNQRTFQCHDPSLDSLNPTQLNYIETYVTDFESALNGPNFSHPTLGYAPYIDMMSFIDFFLVNEISKNVDGYRISSFLHKVRTSEGGKLYAGPLWDFNLGFGNANYCDGSAVAGWQINFYQICGGSVPFWWGKLVQDQNYVHYLNCRWQEMRQGAWNTDSLMARIDGYADYLDESQQRNFQRWPIHGQYVWPNSFVGNSFQEEIDYLKQWLINRIAWMDSNMFGSCTDLGVEVEAQNTVEVFPNPGKQDFTFTFQNEVSNGQIEVMDMAGKVLFKSNPVFGKGHTVRLENFAAGIYHYKVQFQEKVATGKIMIQ
ncbi:CotH kinase family protein [Crocinitomicaceae bacterium]|nr:CotH kinase family protein [Crocinitomicaceae bacterium]